MWDGDVSGTSMLLLVSGTGAIVMWQIVRVIRAKRAEHQATNMLEPDVRERSHQVANQVTEVRAGLRRITRTNKDPLVALIDAIHKGGSHDKSRPGG